MRSRVAVSFALLSLVTACRCDDGGLDALVPALAADRTRVEWPDTYVGANVPETVRLTSVGTGTVQIGAIRIEGDASFFVSAAPDALRRGDSADVVVSFAPSTPGDHAATLLIESDAVTGAKIEVPLSGLALTSPPCDDGKPCTNDAFDPITGACTHGDREGTCDDESACTENDRCFEGACVGDAKHCDDGVTCTLDLCDPRSGCVFSPRSEDCDDGVSCTLDVCDPASASSFDTSGCSNPPAPDGTPCGALVSCGNVDLCIDQICSPVPIPDGTPCSDGDLCTADDLCTAGECTGTPSPSPPRLLFESFRAVDYPASAPPPVVPFVVVDEQLLFGDRVLKRVPLETLPLDITQAQALVPYPQQIVPTHDGRVVVLSTASPLPPGGEEGRFHVSVVRADDLTVERSIDVVATSAKLLGAADGIAFVCAFRSPSFDLVEVPLDNGSDPLVAVDDPACAGGAVGNGRLAVRIVDAPGTSTLAVFRLGIGASVAAGAVALDPALPYIHGVISDDRVAFSTLYYSHAPSHRVVVADLSDPDAPVAKEITAPAGHPLGIIERRLLMGFTGPGGALSTFGAVDLTSIVDAAIDPTFALHPANTPIRGVLGIVNQTFSVIDATGAHLPLPSGMLQTLVETDDAVVPLIAASSTGVTPVLAAGLDAPQPFRQTPLFLSAAVLSAAPLSAGTAPSSLFMAPQAPAPNPVDKLTHLDPSLAILRPATPTSPGGVHFEGAQVQFSVAPLQVVLPADLLGVDALEAVAVSGCTGAALATPRGRSTQPTPVHGVTLTTCAVPGAVVPLANVPIPELDDVARDNFDGSGFTMAISGTDHGDAVSFLAQGTAVLLDVEDPLAPFVRATFGDPDFSGSYLSAGEDAHTWVLLATRPGETPLLFVLDVTNPGAPALRARVDLGSIATDAQTVRRRVLGVSWPRAYLSDWDDRQTVERGHSVVVVDLAVEPPAFVDRLPVASEPTDVTFMGDRVVVARVDGLSVISPPCGP